ncbi:DUF4386 domain-containing protein [Humibacillus xanthopallidus]|uniref:Uncharacterized protein DUF4386 n=1 Tax=Humibacillus xanthopallidus TaxID=412689 RepID=A0A543HX27_9MICO|nr:DUF4386 domain-containing protein [Humibacillus xanthopallidus]TQM62877.1 uncharacterized protein DUF4386 [Humibacillus xanthopallidus]
MKSYRGHAIAVGILLIACSAASILSAIPLGSTLDGPDYLGKLADSDSAVVLTALLEFVWAATGAGIAIGLYPVLRKSSRGLALGSVAARVVEGVFVLIGSLSLLALLTVSQQSLAAGSAASVSFPPTADALLAVRDWAQGFVGMLAFCTGALLYYLVMYRSRVVPRWLSGWGLVGAAMMLVATVNAGFTQEFGFTTVTTVLNIPIGLQEMVLAVWLIVRGFTPRAAGPSVGSIAASTAPSMTP